MSFCGLSKFSSVQSQSASFFLRVYPCITKNIVAIFIWYESTTIYRVNFQRRIRFPCVVLIKRLPRFYHSFSLCWFFLSPVSLFKKKTQSPSPRQEKFSKPVRFFPDPVIPINNEPSLSTAAVLIITYSQTPLIRTLREAQKVLVLTRSAVSSWLNLEKMYWVSFPGTQ